MMKRAVLLILTSSFFTGCALGVKEIKTDFPDKVQLSPTDTPLPEKAVKSSLELEPGLTVSAEWLGNAYTLPTAKSIFGLNNRYVIPYTRLTSLIKMSITNKTGKYIDFSPNNIQLSSLPDNTVNKPLSIDFFKNRWPTQAVKSQEMLIDQATAVGEIIRTILRDKMIAPDSIYNGYLAFPKVKETADAAILSGSLKIDGKENPISFKFGGQ